MCAACKEPTNRHPLAKYCWACSFAKQREANQRSQRKRYRKLVARADGAAWAAV